MIPWIPTFASLLAVTGVPLLVLAVLASTGRTLGRLLPTLVSFGAGALLGAAVFHLLPEAYERHPSVGFVALSVAAGHTFYLILGPGCFPINVLDRIKACPEVCGIFCATANPVQVLRARTEQGAGILGVVDGSSPLGVETEQDVADRKAMLRRFGYKF